MSVESNKKLIRRFYEEVWVKGNVDVADEIYHTDYVRHDLQAARAISGPEGQKKIARDLRGAFPDMTWTVEMVIGEDDYVVGRWVMTGTHTKAWNDIQPTNKKMVYTGVNIFRFRDGKVSELWNFRDDLGLMRQLGVPLHGGSAVDHKK